jgi:hypothetical protein
MVSLRRLKVGRAAVDGTEMEFVGGEPKGGGPRIMEIVDAKSQARPLSSSTA